MVEADVAEVQESLTAMLRVSGQYTSQDAPSTLRDSARSRKEHLAPLFFLLHRRLVVETIELGPKGPSFSLMLGRLMSHGCHMSGPPLAPSARTSISAPSPLG